MLVLPSIITASRKVVAARLTTLRVRELSTRCPLILLLGLNPSQETKAFSLRHFAMLVPISLSRFRTARMFNPGIVVRSTACAESTSPRIRPSSCDVVARCVSGKWSLRGETPLVTTRNCATAAATGNLGHRFYVQAHAWLAAHRPTGLQSQLLRASGTTGSSKLRSIPSPRFLLDKRVRRAHPLRRINEVLDLSFVRGAGGAHLWSARE